LAQIAALARAGLPVRSRHAGAIMSLFVGGKRIGRQLPSSDRMMPAGWSSAGSERRASGTGQARGTTTEHFAALIDGRIAMLRLGHEPAPRRNSGRNRPILIKAF
jgi:hypothetical protein